MHKDKNILLAFFLFTSFSLTTSAQKNIDSIMPIRGFAINAPKPVGLDSFIRFINEELAPRKVNTLLVLIDYHYQFTSRPELTDSFALSKADVKRIVDACKKNNIKAIPHINLLGHQSWANRTGKLLQVYPQFDETPDIKMPVKYAWPNTDNLYCKSYCPLYPELHKVLFDVIDEICDAFESDIFHGGMDEVFFIGDDKCKRCAGKSKAELFAGEVKALHDHLAKKNRTLWIWGDRLIDGKTTGLGMWEASYDNTYLAIDMIPKDVVICDWHYERADKIAPYFAIKGFKVITCPWRDPSTAVSQVNDMANFRKESTPEMKERFLGVMETTWFRTDSFLKGYYESLQNQTPISNTPWDCFRAMSDRINKLD